MGPEDNIIKISEIVQSYPLVVKPVVSKLSHKPLDKMIKKYAEKYNFDSSYFPLSSDRWDKVDLYYWIKQMFGYNDHELQLQNWRDIIERKVCDNKMLQEKLVSDLYSFDIQEANYWARKYCIEDQIVNVEDNSEENWEDEANDSQVKHFPTNETVEHFELPISSENVLLVDNDEKLKQFISDLKTSAAVVIGLDAEFMCDRGEQILCLVQISIKDKIYLIDWIEIKEKLTDSELSSIKSSLFMDKNKIIVGFGIIGDVRLLSKSHKILENIPDSCRNILDLECIGSTLLTMLSIRTSNVKGLSGLCQSVLGKPLSKAEQIADWTKRPLRPSQIIYAALDAWICSHIYLVLENLAKEKNVFDDFKKLISDELNKSDVVKTKTKDKKISDRKELRAQLEKTIPQLNVPLFSEPVDPLKIKLVCDDMLQGLCRKLRMFGIDCLALNNGQDHLDCAKFASASVKRYVVSRGLPAAKIAKQLPPGHVLSIKSNDTELQLEEVFRYFNLTVSGDNLFKRCVICNGGYYYELSQSQLKLINDNILRRKSVRYVRPIDDDSDDADDDFGDFDDNISENSFGDPILSQYQGCDRAKEEDNRWITVKVTSSISADERPGRVNVMTGDTEEGVNIQVEKMAMSTIEKYQQFWICGQCGKVYFEGSHWERATEQAKNIIKDQ